MSIIEAKNLNFYYEEPTAPSLQNITFSIERGEFVVILGHNGCGKSTLAKHLNALLHPKTGRLLINGLDATDKNNLWTIRKTCGMVFQNPDNQFVSSVIEEELAFGPDNYDFPESEIESTIQRVLEIVGMSGYEKKSPHLLSGGQKQRIAIAGILAVDPDILVLDEATSMLDPEGRNDILNLILRLNHDYHKTIIMITHYIEEAYLADRILLMSKGEIVKDGSSRDILSDKEALLQCRITPPLPVKAYYDLSDSGVNLSKCPITGKELADLLCQLN